MSGVDFWVRTMLLRVWSMLTLGTPTPPKQLSQNPWWWDPGIHAPPVFRRFGTSCSVPCPGVENAPLSRAVHFGRCTVTTAESRDMWLWAELSDSPSLWSWNPLKRCSDLLS